MFEETIENTSNERLRRAHLDDSYNHEHYARDDDSLYTVLACTMCSRENSERDADTVFLLLFIARGSIMTTI